MSLVVEKLDDDEPEESALEEFDVVSTFWIVIIDVLSVIWAGTISVPDAEIIILTVSEDSSFSSLEAEKLTVLEVSPDKNVIVWLI